jgi:hypothetical protein
MEGPEARKPVVTPASLATSPAQPARSSFEVNLTTSLTVKWEKFDVGRSIVIGRRTRSKPSGRGSLSLRLCSDKLAS